MAEKKRNYATDDEKDRLHKAIENDDLDTIKTTMQSIDVNAWIHVYYFDRYTGLHYSVQQNKIDCVRLYLQLGADITIRDRIWEGRQNTEKTPLERAVDDNKVDIVYCMIKEFNKDVSSVDQNYQLRIRKMVQDYERSHPKLMIQSQATPQNVMAGVQQLKMVDDYQQRRSQLRQQQPQNQQRQPEQAQQLQLQINNLMTQFQTLQTTVTTEQEKSQLLERRCKSLESALASEQEKSRSLEARCQSLESSVAAEQQRSQSRYQNHEERLKEVEDTVERLWSISRDEVNLTKEFIGSGGWGYVTEADFRGRKVAAKCLHKAITSQHNQQLFAKEMKIFARCRHRNLLEFIGAVPDHPAIIVTELMDTDLREALSNGSATPNHIHPICMDVAQALSYLHGIQPHPIIHRDVSAPNVLLKAVDKAGWIAKLSDLGSAQFANIAQTFAPGCAIYAAPEVCQESSARNQTTKMDVYSYGVLLIEVLIRQMPIGNVADLITTIPPECLSYVPLIRQCTTNEPSRRPTMIQVINTLNTITI